MQLSQALIPRHGQRVELATHSVEPSHLHAKNKNHLSQTKFRFFVVRPLANDVGDFGRRRTRGRMPDLHWKCLSGMPPLTPEAGEVWLCRFNVRADRYHLREFAVVIGQSGNKS